MRSRRSVTKQFVLVWSLLFFVGCQDTGGSSTDAQPSQPVEDKIQATYDMNQYKVTNLVCDPFNDDEDPADIEMGVKASLYWVNTGESTYTSAEDYIQFANASDEDLFFSKIDVPTRRFELGFPTETGELLKDDDGEDLVEYFALRFDGQIQLSDDEEEGLYELAILSDDGAVMRVDPQGGQAFSQVLDNDGNHPTRFGCGDEARFQMTKEDRLSFQLDYYQGPKHHIAAVLMWRKIEQDTPQDELCGATGNSKFFDFNNNSEPQQAYLDLLSRGWKPLSADNYAIKDEDSHNPCFDGVKPVITDFKVEEDLDGGLRVTWTTDVYATSQVRIVNLDTGEETLTESDNNLRKSHFVRIFPEKNVPLLIQAVSISDSMGKALSDPITLVWE